MDNSYFRKLNYTLANEDTSLELGILPNDASHVMAVGGSGGRVLPLLAKAPKLVTCVDVSQEQLYLCELRVTSMKALSHSEFLEFWGYPPINMKNQDDSLNRKKLFGKICKEGLSPSAALFFKNTFSQCQWKTILYEGKWEKTIAKLSQINRNLTGVRGLELFSAMNYEEHADYLKRKFPKLSWNLTLLLLGNANVFNALLYRGQFPKKNLNESSYAFYKNSFDRIFKQGPARQNFFLQLIFFGKVIYSEGTPIECDPRVYEKAKKNVELTKFNYVLGDIVSVAEQSPEKIDMLSLSDVPSYFNEPLEKVYLQRIKKRLSKNGMVVLRNYLRKPKGRNLSGYSTVTEKYVDLIQKEKVQVYGVEVFQNGGADS